VTKPPLLAQNANANADTADTLLSPTTALLKSLIAEEQNSNNSSGVTGVTETEIDLTEAENYALYVDTAAPHATASEFDENSCFYSDFVNNN
jgi:hypothetical protein